MAASRSALILPSRAMRSSTVSELPRSASENETPRTDTRRFATAEERMRFTFGLFIVRQAGLRCRRGAASKISVLLETLFDPLPPLVGERHALLVGGVCPQETELPLRNLFDVIFVVCQIGDKLPASCGCEP